MKMEERIVYTCLVFLCIGVVPGGFATKRSDDILNDELKALIEQQATTIQKLQIRLDTQENTIQRLQSKVTSLSSTLDLQERRLQNEQDMLRGVQDLQQTQEDSIGNLTARLDAQQLIQASDPQTLQYRLQIDEYKLQRLESSVSSMNGSIISLENSRLSLDSRLDKQEQRVAIAVNFGADHNNVPVRTTGPVIFDHVQVNYGGGYNPTTGVFTAPASGLYLFLLHVRSGSGGDVSLSVYYPRVGTMCTTFVAGNANDLDDQGSCSVVFPLNVGEEVYVKLASHHDPYPVVCSESTRFIGTLVTPS